MNISNGEKGEKKEFDQSCRTKLGKASVFSCLTFSWINSLLNLGHKKPLSLDDIPILLPEDDAELVYQKFSCVWDSLNLRTKKNAKLLLLETLLKTHWKEIIFAGFCAFLRTLAVVAAPWLLNAFVQYSTSTINEHKQVSKGLILVGCLAVVKFIESLLQRHWYFSSRRTGMRMRSAVMVAIYQKMLKLSSLGRKRHSTGEIMNYIAVDAYRLGDTIWWFHTEWSLVLQLFLALAVLFKIVGLGSLPGLIPIIFVGFLNLPLAKMYNKYQSQYAIVHNERLRATMEVLNNMKIIKLQSWEDKFKNMIDLLRSDEHKQLTSIHIRKPYATVLYWMSPTIASTVIFIGCLLTRSAPLNAATIFTVLATARCISEPMRWIPEALSALIHIKISLDRLNNFLLDDENKKGELNLSSQTSDRKSDDNLIQIQGGNYTWEPESDVLALEDINLEVKRGSKLAVCGPVGSGKSSLLYAMLGEIPKIAEPVNVNGSIAYVSQVPWIQSGTIRENILCGKHIDKIRYGKVIKACALDKDISSFSHGDLTEIGQRGINLSGGQKQRIQLARAVYNEADIYLLDDPFSAVDAQTAEVLFNECILAALKDKTVILVTHQVEFLRRADKILVMERGQIKQSGGYDELLAPGTAFEQLVNAHKNAATELVSLDQESQTESLSTDIDQFEQHNDNTEAEISGDGQLTKEEEREIGNVGLKQLLDYLQISKGFLLLSLVILPQFAFSGLQAGASYWMALVTRSPKFSNSIIVGCYAGISISSAPFMYLKTIFAALLGLKASKAFFSGVNNSLFKAPMLFFDSTPVGRIYTRVSSDMCALDFDLPVSVGTSATAGIELLAIIAVMATVTWPVLIVAVPAILSAICVQGYYLSTARELVRINGTTKAPILNYAAETSQGVVIIRAFDIMEMFFKNYLKLIDTDARLFFHSNAAMEWLILRVETLQNLILVTAALLIVLLPWKHLPGFVGLSLSYAFTLNTAQVVMTRSNCNFLNQIVSVERIKQFMNVLPEPPSIVEDMRPPSSWPCHGRIEFQDVKIRYHPNSPLVLKGITCTFAEGTRVGVVGRTGSGKTTLVSALFRLVEPESGRILIDGLDVCKMGLKDLRTKLSIIPQEPTLFKGNVRSNLDPLGIYSDKEIWEAIEKCQLKATISNLPKLLDSSVSDEGDNWSIGQRQLFCLGRVLLRRNTVLVLDEATASIDSATDVILQGIIRQEFSGCTVITIAHRVPTVIDSDMVMVLSNGELVEHDVPSKLLETNSSFSKLVAEYWSSNRRS